MVVVIAVILVAIVAYEVITAPGPSCTSTWACGADYPVQVGGTYGIGGQQCIGGTGYVDCIGGIDANGGTRSEVFSATFSPAANITGWTASPTQYPQAINGQSCVSGQSYVYCVGGSYDEQGDDVASSYYAPLNSSGVIGTWMSTTAYPIPADTLSCVGSSSYIYCIGGENETDGQAPDAAPTSTDWYAPISASGIGNWSRTASLPANYYFPDCLSDGGYVYCVGGTDSSGNTLTTTYYAPLTSTGIGAWTTGSPYLIDATAQACAISSGVVYCVGGVTAESSNGDSYTNGVYYATISSSGIGTWKQSPNYPDSTWTDCAISSGYLYCVGGFDSSTVTETYIVNYASLASLSS